MNNPKTTAWEDIAATYGAPWGKVTDPGDVVEYARGIMSALSAAQSGYGIDPNSGANDHVNAAKLMLSNMIAAARAKERVVGKPCVVCGGKAHWIVVRGTDRETFPFCSDCKTLADRLGVQGARRDGWVSLQKEGS